MQIFYFGCWDEPGHYLFFPDGRLAHKTRHLLPWELKDIDCGLCPKTAIYQMEGAASLHHKDGWTALAFWDRSADTRGNSNSAFVVDEETDFDTMLKYAHERFPKIMQRIKFNVFLYKS